MFRTALRTSAQRCYINPSTSAVSPRTAGLAGAIPQLQNIQQTSRGVGSFATRPDNEAVKLDKGKREVLDGQNPNTPSKAEWHEGMASDSEAFVKAIRSEVKHSDKEIQHLQKASEEELKQKRKLEAEQEAEEDK
ncbi:hypothetical protein DFH27DRAFT_356076 [Peziza echinospora]|nr:hypothetical protein DFH27DRAFT_356076 [Peziza echinospora]